MNIKPIKTRKDYRNALKEIESLMNAKANTPAGDRLDVLTTSVEAYEQAHFPLDLLDPPVTLAAKFSPRDRSSKAHWLR